VLFQSFKQSVMQANNENSELDKEMEMNEENRDSVMRDNPEVDKETDMESGTSLNNGSPPNREQMDMENGDGSDNESIPISEQMEWHSDWTDEERKSLTDHLNYANVYYNVLIELIQSGTPIKPFQMPKKPKSKLADFSPFGKKASSIKLTGKKLHEYLASKIVRDSSSFEMPDVSIIGENITMDEMIQHLRSAYKYVGVQENKMLRVYLDYGEWLEAAAVKFNEEKQNGFIEDSWKNWLKNEVGITDSYGRKLRLVGRLLKGYAKFRSLSITFTEMFSRRAEIGAMLRSSSKCAKFWKDE
jgi:hypothetical protein